jgi:hypothetical protein
MVADLNPHGGSYPHAIVNVDTTLFSRGRRRDERHAALEDRLHRRVGLHAEPDPAAGRAARGYGTPYPREGHVSRTR